MTAVGAALALPAGGLLAGAAAQEATPAEPVATPVTEPATPLAGTPATSPVAATPVAEPVATPIPDPLLVVREQVPTYASVPRRGGRLRMLRPPAAPTNFSPVAFRQDFQVFASYLDPLLRSDPVTMEPRPWLATEWETNTAGNEIRLSLRDDVRWHDGSRFTAADVAFSLLAYRDDPDSGVWNLLVTTADVTADDDTTVVVSLSEPDPAWTFNVGTLLIFQRAAYVDAWDREPAGERRLPASLDDDDMPVGTGPWRFSEAREDGVRFVRNDVYWQAPPWFDTLELTWEADSRSRVEQWVAGDSDLTWPVRVEEVGLARGTPGRIYVGDAASVMFMAFNFDNPTGIPRFFDDQRLREALDLAIDRDRLADTVFGGYADLSAAGTIAQPWARDESLPARRYDRQAASARLAELGWVDLNGDGILDSAAGVPFDITVIVSTASRRELIRAVRAVKADWAAIGVSLRIQLLAPDDFQLRVNDQHDFDLVAYAYDLYPGFTDFDLYGSAWDIRRNVQGWNPGGYADPVADEAIASYLAATTVADQRAALRTLQSAVNDNLFGIWLGFPADLVLVAADIDGFTPNKLWQTFDTRLLWRNDDATR